MSSLLRLGRKQKNSSNPFRIGIFLFLSYVYSFGIDTINTFMHPRSSFENYTWFQTKIGKNPARWGGTYLYSLYKGVTHPGGGGGRSTVHIFLSEIDEEVAAFFRNYCWNHSIQWTLKDSNFQGKSKKVRVIGSSKKIAGSKEKTVLRHSEHFNHS